MRANPDLELVATDERQAVLTVRVKRTGQILTVRADEVVAGTAFLDLDTTGGTSGQPAASGQEAPPASATASGTAGRVDVSSPGAGVSVESGAAGGITVETPAGSTPISRAARAPLPSAEPATGVPPSTQSLSAGANLDENRLQRRTQPVQCRGTDTVRLDGVLLQVEEVVVQAAQQCEVHITNSHVVGRVALQVAGDVTVTIENSIIEGQVAIRAAQSSAVTARSSTIVGRVQKLQAAAVSDLGQNVWR